MNSFLRHAPLRARPVTLPRVLAGAPPFDRPTLYSQSNRVPQITGSGTSGTGGNVPRVTAIEPPLAGNPRFKGRISNALCSDPAALDNVDTDPRGGPALHPATKFEHLN